MWIFCLRSRAGSGPFPHRKPTGEGGGEAAHIFPQAFGMQWALSAEKIDDPRPQIKKMISEGPLGKVSYGRSLRSRRRDRVRDKELEHPTLNVPAAVFMMDVY